MRHDKTLPGAFPPVALSRHDPLPTRLHAICHPPLIVKGKERLRLTVYNKPPRLPEDRETTGTSIYRVMDTAVRTRKKYILVTAMENSG